MKTVLVTDDAAFMRLMLKDLMTKMNLRVVEAVNGADMLDKYEQERPDLVTLDITMPVLDGLEALKQLRSKHPEANVVMCSAMGQQAMVIEAIQNGAKDFIVKPFVPDRVKETISKFLGV